MVNAEYIQQTKDYAPDSKTTTIKLGELNRFEGEQYDLNDDRDFSKYVADVERLVRNSFEYRYCVQFLKNNGMDTCAVFPNATSRDGSGVKVELHHTPLTLFDIVMAVIRRRRSNNESMNIYDVAYEVMYNHYMKYVGLIPLCQTVHEMVHNQFYFIPTDKQFGAYRPFVEQYYNYLDPEVLDAIDNAEQATASGKFNDQYQLFNNHPIYVQPYNYNPQQIVERRQDLYDRVDEIKGNSPRPKKQDELKVMCRIVNNKK